MRKIKLRDVIELRKMLIYMAGGLTAKQMSDSVRRAPFTIRAWRKKARNLGLDYQKAQSMSDEELEQLFFKKAGPKPKNLYPIDIEKLVDLLNQGMTKQDAFQEYLKDANENKAKPFSRASYFLRVKTIIDGWKKSIKNGIQPTLENGQKLLDLSFLAKKKLRKGRKSKVPMAAVDIRKVLKFYAEGKKQSEIARCTGCVEKTVGQWIERAKELDIDSKAAREMSKVELESRFRKKCGRKPVSHYPIDFEKVLAEVKIGKTVQELFLEYKKEAEEHQEKPVSRAGFYLRVSSITGRDKKKLKAEETNS